MTNGKNRIRDEAQQARTFNLWCTRRENDRAMIPKLCLHRHLCRKCAFDQWLDELDELDAQGRVSVAV